MLYSTFANNSNTFYVNEFWERVKSNTDRILYCHGKYLYLQNFLANWLGVNGLKTETSPAYNTVKLNKIK